MLSKMQCDYSATLKGGGGSRKRERQKIYFLILPWKTVKVKEGGRNQTTGVFISPTSSPRLAWCFWGTSPRQYSPWSSLTLLTRGLWGIYLQRLGTLAVKLPIELADMVFSGKSIQSLMVCGRNEDCLYWVQTLDQGKLLWVASPLAGCWWN